MTRSYRLILDTLCRELSRPGHGLTPYGQQGHSIINLYEFILNHRLGIGMPQLPLHLPLGGVSGAPLQTRRTVSRPNLHLRTQHSGLN